MADIETPGILDEIQSLVSDKLQVVSYKWLSRNFLLSSDAAKRLLQKFVEKHGNDVEVIYSVSGWLKNDPSAYHVRLVSSPKLAGAKQELYENCSVQVYSVQACIPKDVATLWNAEFVQAEELFKQPLSVDNGFWDNRFSGVLNPYLKRNVDGTSVSNDAPQASVTTKSKLSNQSVTIKPPPTEKVQQAKPSANMDSPSIVNDVKKEITVSEGSKTVKDKEKATHPHEVKKKIQPGNKGALANMWGRATSVSKENNISISTPNPAEAQESALEELEDDEVVNINNSDSRGKRKRRAIFYSSDEEEEEDAVNLSSPDPPKSKTSSVLKPCSNIPEKEKNDEKLKGEGDLPPPNPKPPQRKKVLKKRIDERGREVTEVVWEDEETKKESKASDEAADRPPQAKKPHVMESNAPTNQGAAKAGNKKGANKDPKQGNILSFFKKAS